jgi:hypothetical protein
LEEGIVPGGVSLLHTQQAVADLLDPLNLRNITRPGTGFKHALLGQQWAVVGGDLGAVVRARWPSSCGAVLRRIAPGKIENDGAHDQGSGGEGGP